MRVNFQRDPEQFGKSIERKDPKAKLVLGLDMASNCGMAYAFWRPGQPAVVQPEHCGQWDLSAGPYDSGAIRFVRMRRFLEYMKPDLVAYELVKYTPAEKLTKYNAGAIMARAATSCTFFGALSATVSTWCEENDIPCIGFDIGRIKKRATGKGNANKVQMIQSCNEHFNIGLDPEGYESTGADNVADAVWVAVLALEDYAPGLTFEKEQE